MFCIDITDMAFYGEQVNTLVVEVDGRSQEGWFYEGVGIYRDVKLYVKDMLHLAKDGVFLKPVLDEKGNWSVHLLEGTGSSSGIGGCHKIIVCDRYALLPKEKMQLFGCAGKA